MTMPDDQSVFRRIPAVDQLLLRPAVASWIACTSREFVVSEIQKLLNKIRATIRTAGKNADTDIRAEQLETDLIEAKVSYL